VIRISVIAREMLQRSLEERQRQSPKIQLRTALQKAARRNGQRWTEYSAAVIQLAERL
jgi:dsRNA-specific ribonuclease